MGYPNIIEKLNTKVTYTDAYIVGDVKLDCLSSQITIKPVMDVIQFNINGGSAYNKGAWIALEGCDNYNGNFPAGSFNIRATNSSGKYSEFRGTPDGTLIWNERDVITEVYNSFTTDENSGYLTYTTKLSNGLMIIQGLLSVSMSTTQGTITFPQAFTKYPSVSATIRVNDADITLCIPNISLPTFTYTVHNYSSDSQVLRYIAIGYWK